MSLSPYSLYEELELRRQPVREREEQRLLREAKEAMGTEETGAIGEATDASQPTELQSEVDDHSEQVVDPADFLQQDWNLEEPEHVGGGRSSCIGKCLSK